MTHTDKLRTGYSKAFSDGWNNIKKEVRVKCKNCPELVSKYYAKKHDGLCVNCRNKKRR